MTPGMRLLFYQKKLKVMKHKYAFLLILLIAFHAVNNYVWLKQDNESLAKDTASHVNRIISIREELQNIDLFREKIPEEPGPLATVFAPGSACWPQFFHFIAALISFGCKDILFCIRFYNMLYFALLVVAVYFLGKKLFNPQAGMLAACIISFYPGVFGLSRKCGLDFPLIAFICVVAYFLLNCDNFQKRLPSILFGVSLGVATFFKVQILIFIAGPLAYVALKGLIYGRDKKGCFSNLFFSLALAAAISLIWWNRIFFIEAPEANAYAKLVFKYFSINVPLQMRKYFEALYIHMSPLFSAAFLLGLFLCFRKASRDAMFFLGCWIIPPYLFFSGMLPYNNQRYIFPVFGALTLISAMGLMQIPAKKTKRFLIASLLILGIVQFFLVSYRGALEPFVFTSEFGQPPEKNNHRAVMEKFNWIIETDCPGQKRIAIIEEQYFKTDFCIRLGYLLKVLNKENKVFLSAGGFIVPRFQVSKEFLDNVNDFQFLIAFSENEEGPDFSGLLASSISAEREAVLKVMEQFKSYMVMERAMLLPDEIYVFLLRRQED